MFYSSRSIRNRYVFAPRLNFQKVINFIIAEKKSQKIGFKKYLYMPLNIHPYITALEYKIAYKYPYSTTYSSTKLQNMVYEKF